jgi:hypothetical protein
MFSFLVYSFGHVKRISMRTGMLRMFGLDV